MVYLIVMLLVAFAAVVVALQNPIPIAVTLLMWRPVSTLASVILISFAIGLLLGICIMIPMLLKKKRKIIEQPKEVPSPEVEKKQEEPVLKSKENFFKKIFRRTK
ncbi:MAG: LapA family protein [Elusimicrobia bacterium]|nr:LapA family protein [Elusimicrobiota bacterium]